MALKASAYEFWEGNSATTAEPTQPGGRPIRGLDMIDRDGTDAAVGSTYAPFHSVFQHHAPGLLTQLRTEWTLPALLRHRGWPPAASGVALPLSALPSLRRERNGALAWCGDLSTTELRRHACLPFDWSASVPPALKHAEPQRLRSFVAGRLCAELALNSLVAEATELSDYNAAQAISEGVRMGPHGEPIWPSLNGQHVTGSITHSQHWAWAVACRKNSIQGIGIDCEELMNEQSHTAANQICFTARELTRFPNLNRNAALATVIYSAKEAFYKAVWPYINRFVDFLEVEVINLDPISGTLLLQSQSSDLKRLLREQWLHLFTIDDETIHTASAIFDNRDANNFVIQRPRKAR